MIHHWNNITEVKKLSESVLVPGVIEENIYRGPMLGQPMPVAWTPGESIKYNRELSELKDDVRRIAVGGQTSWSSSMTYTQVEVELKMSYVQRILDSFVRDVYGTINDYRAIKVMECRKGVYVDLNEQIVYGDLTYGDSASGLEFDGMHAWVEGTGSDALATSGVSVNYDGEEAGLNFQKMRPWLSSMKLGYDILYMPFQLSNRLSAALMEGGFNNTTSRTTSTVMAQVQFGINDHGKRALFWDATPIVSTDYLVAEEGDTGQGSDARAAHTAGDAQYSIFAVKFGNVFMQEGGFMYGFGSTEQAGDMYKTTPFEKLENYIGEGLRLESFGATLLGSKYGLGRMCDIEDVDVIFT